MNKAYMIELNRTQNELDFVDIDIENDMPLFIDPYFLSIREDRWSINANWNGNTFLNKNYKVLRS